MQESDHEIGGFILLQVLFYFSLLGLYLLCVVATITNPKLPAKGDPSLPEAERNRDRWVIGHSFVVLAATTFAVINLENYNVSLKLMALMPVIIHGVLFPLGKQLSKNFWHWFIVAFELVIGAYSMFIATLH